MKTKITMLLVLAAVMAFAPAAYANQALVGTWGWEYMPEWVYVFNADNTGTRGVGEESESFTWEVVGNNELRLDRGPGTPAGEIRNERWSYTISGDAVTMLTIDSLQQAGLTFSYFRQ